MALEIFKKIKDGFKKVVGGIKKGAKWLGTYALKPLAKSIDDIAAPVVNSSIPGAGTLVQKGVDMLMDGSNNIVGANGHGIRVNNPKIKMK